MTVPKCRTSATRLAVCSHHPGGITRGRRGGHCLYFCTECGQWFVSASDLYYAQVSAFLQTLSQRGEHGDVQRNRKESAQRVRLAPR